MEFQNTQDLPKSVAGPSVWTGKELLAKPDQWLSQWSQEQINELVEAANHFESLNFPLELISTENFP